MSEFSKRLQTLRRKTGLSQESMAEQLHITRQAVSKWEQGQSIPDIDICLKLCKVLKVTPNQLLLGLDDTEKCPPKDKNYNWDILFIVSSAFLMLICVCGTIMLLQNLYNGKVFEPSIHTLATLMVCISPLAFISVLLLYIRKKRIK